MVDTVYADPATESEWHAYYAGYLLQLLSVPGFATAQRFKAIGVAPSRFLAMYTIASAAVYSSQRYKDIGGGGSRNLRFRGAYKMWTRNLFAGAVRAPGVADDEFVFAVDCEAPDEDLARAFDNLVWLNAVGLQMTTKYRGLAVLDGPGAKRAQQTGRGFVYAPFTPQLTSNDQAARK